MFWFTIFLGVGIYFVFYRFTVNFGYHWWLTFLALSSFVFNRVVKYRLYNPRILILSFTKTLIWFHLIVRNVFVSAQRKATCYLIYGATLIRVINNKLVFFFKNLV